MIYLKGDAPADEIEHEVGHAIEQKLFDAEKVRALKQRIVKGMTIDDIKIVKGTSGTISERMFIVTNPNLIDRYQGRIYADSKQECLDEEGNIDIDKMHEFISVAFQYYCDHPDVMKRRYPEMYQLVKESVE